MEGIFAAVPQKMRVGKVALPETAYISQPQKADVCCGRSAQGRVLLRPRACRSGAFFP